MKKITAYLVCLLTVLVLPLVVSAQETTLTTKVPSSHTLYIDIAGNGEVVVDGVPCKQTGDLQIQRGTTPQVSVKPADGAVLKNVHLNEKDITEDLRKGAYILPKMCSDTKLIIVFETAPGTPQTGDPVPLAALCLAMVLSFIGMLCDLRTSRKREI